MLRLHLGAGPLLVFASCATSDKSTLCQPWPGNWRAGAARSTYAVAASTRQALCRLCGELGTGGQACKHAGDKRPETVPSSHGRGRSLVHAEFTSNHLIQTGLAWTEKDQQEQDREIKMGSGR